MRKLRPLRLLKLALLTVFAAVVLVLAFEYTVKPMQKAAAIRAEAVAAEQRRLAEREANAVPRRTRPAHPDRPTVALIDFTIDRDSYRRQQSAAAFAELLGLDLAGDDRFVWLDRADVQRVRDELELSTAMSYGSSAEAMQLGRWLNAHLIVTGRFVDTAGPGQRLIIEVIETLTADRLTGRSVDFPHDLRDMNDLPDQLVQESRQAIGEALAVAQEILRRHRGSTVVSLISIANMTGDSRMDYLPGRLKTQIMESAESTSGLRIVQVQNPDPAMTEQDLSLTGLTALEPEAWRSAADVYVWGTISRPTPDPQAPQPEVERLDPATAKIRLAFTVWNGFDDPQEIALDGTRDQIDALFDRVADRVWGLVQQPLPEKLDLKKRTAVARNFSSGTGFSFSAADGPESDAARRMNHHIQSKQAAWFFDPESSRAATGTVFFRPVIHPDRALSGQLGHIRAIDRVLYRFDWEVGRDRTKPTTDELERLADSSIAARKELADLIIPSRKRRHHDLLLADSRLPADMPLAARAELHNENLRGLTQLGHLLVEKIPAAELDAPFGVVWMERDDVAEIILDMPGGSPARIVEAWEAWWPILRAEWREEAADPLKERNFLTARRERRLRAAYQGLGRSDELTALLNDEKRDLNAGQNARLTQPLDFEKTRSLIEVYNAEAKRQSPRPARPPNVPPALSEPVAMDAPVVPVRGLQLRMIPPQKDVAAGVRMSYHHREFGVHQLHNIGGQLLLVATRRSLYPSANARRGENRSRLDGIFALISPKHLQLKHLSFPGIDAATVTDAQVVGGDFWVSTDVAGLHKIQMSSGNIEPVEIVGELRSEHITHLAVTEAGVVVVDERGRASLLKPTGDNTWRARDLKWEGGSGTSLRSLETHSSMLLVKSESDVQLIDLGSDRVYDLGNLVSQHENIRFSSRISDAAFYKNDLLMIARQKLYRVTGISSADPQLEVIADGLFRNTDDRLAIDGHHVWVMMTKNDPKEQAWHAAPLQYNKMGNKDELRRSTVALWDMKQKRWAGQFHIAGEATHVRAVGKWLLVASNNGIRDMVLFDRAAVMAGMRYAPAEAHAASSGLSPEFGGIAQASAVMREAATGDTDALRRRIAAGELIDNPARDDWTPLMSAVLSGHSDTVRLLLEAGANPNQENRGTLRTTPATLAAALDRPDLLELLYTHGLDVDGYANLWANPAVAAVLHRSHGALRWLAEHDAKLNYWLKTVPGRNMWWHSPLFVAISRGDVPTVKLLLELGASPSHVHGPDTYTTPVQYALSLHRDDIAKLLIEAGADLNEKNSFGGTAFHYVLTDFGPEARSIPLAEMAALMLDRGADSTRSPRFVYWAYKTLGADMTERLTEAGNDLNRVMPEDTIRGFGGPRHITGPFTFAVALAENPEVQLLTSQLEGNAIDLDLPVGDHRQGDLIASTLASRSQYIAALDLVERGYGIDLVDTYGNTALHRATRSRRASDVRILLSLGSNPFIRNRDGESVFDLAKENDLRHLLNRESLYAVPKPGP